ncbi:MAG: O-antigen ligase family protein [Oscillospiraceae bacterium]|nr:O-antigen ligase family protein [Oscillospiraceae bacterium]
MTKQSHPLARLTKPAQPLFLILCLFTVTFFVYRDFDIRMLYGFGVLCVLLAVHLLRRGMLDRPPALDPLRLSFLVLTAVIFLNFLRPDSRHDADSLSYVIATVICCCFVWLADPGEREGKWALGVCFAGGLFLAGFVLFFECFPGLFWNGFLQKLSHTAGEYLCTYVPRGYGFTLGGCTYTNYVLYIAMSVCCGYLACGRKWDWKSWAALACIGVFLTAILLVGRRGELLGALVCIMLLILALCKPKLRRRLIVGGLIAGIAAIAILIPLLPWLRQFQPLIRYVMTFEQLLSGQDITSGRVELYVLAWNTFLEQPIFGMGFDQFHTLIPPEFLALHGQDVEDVHCIYLQFFTEMGIVSAPLLIAPLVYGYYLVCRQFGRLKSAEGMTTARILCVTSFMIQSFLLFLGIYDPNFQRVIFWCFYAIAIIMLLAALKLEGFVPDDPVSRGLGRFIGFFAPLCGRIWDFLTKRDWLAFADLLCPVLAFFTCTFFFYRDFGFRMIYGYGVLGMILALHLLRRLGRNEKPDGSPVTVGAGILAAVILLHFLLPGARHDVDTLSYQISMLICMAYVICSLGESRRALGACRVMHLGALGMAAFVVVFTLLPGAFLKFVYPLLSETARRYYDFFAPLGYGVSLGTYSYTDYVLFLGAAVCCGDLAVKPRTRRRILADGISLALILIAMVVLGRRGELLAAVLAVLVLVLALCSRKKRRIILISGAVLGALAATLVLLFLPALGKVPVLARYVETVEQLLSGGDITSGRGALMKVAMDGFRSNPIFGVGWGQYVRLSAQIGMCDTDGNLIEDCHNIYLQFACETGIVGAVLIIAPIVYLLWLTCRMLREAKYLEDKNPLRFASISFLIQFFLLFLGLYDPSFQKIVFWCFYGLALLMLKVSMTMSGWKPTDPVSRMLGKLAGWIAVPGNWIWDKLCRKEAP